MIPTILSSTNEAMHIFSDSSNLQSTGLFKNKNSQKPDIPPKKSSIRQQIKDKEHYFIETDDLSSKSLPKMQSSKKISPVLKPKSWFTFSQKLASFATFPPRSENSLSRNSTEKKKFLSGITGHFKPQINKKKKSLKLFERSESARNSEASSGENSPMLSRAFKKSVVANSSETGKIAKNPGISRPKSGLIYTSSQIKLARICITKSVTDMPTAPSYGEYDNLETVRTKRSYSLGPQVQTPLPKKSVKSSEAKIDSHSRLLPKSMNHDLQEPPSNISAHVSKSRPTERDSAPLSSNATRSRLAFRRKSLDHDRSRQNDCIVGVAAAPSAVDRAMSFQTHSDSQPFLKNTSPATVPIKSKLASTLNRNVPTLQTPYDPSLHEDQHCVQPVLKETARSKSPQLADRPRVARPRSLTSSPRPAPRIKPALVKTPPSSMRNLQRSKKPSKLLKPGYSFDEEGKTEINSPGTDSSSIAGMMTSLFHPS